MAATLGADDEGVEDNEEVETESSDLYDSIISRESDFVAIKASCMVSIRPLRNILRYIDVYIEVNVYILFDYPRCNHYTSSLLWRIL